MEKAEIFSSPAVPGSGGGGQSLCKMVEVVITLESKVLVKKIEPHRFNPTSESPM